MKTTAGENTSSLFHFSGPLCLGHVQRFKTSSSVKLKVVKRLIHEGQTHRIQRGHMV